MTTITFQTNSKDAKRLYLMLQSYGVDAIEMIEDVTLEEINEPFELTEEDLIAIAKSDKDIKANRVSTAEEVQKRARALCMK